MKKTTIEGIEIKLTKKKIKNLNLSVHPPSGEVRLSVPLRTTNQVIKKFVESKVPWIRKHQEKFKNHKPPVEYHYITGESHYFMGKPYKLNVIYIDKNPSKVQLRDRSLDMYVKEEMTKEKRAKLLQKWRRQELKMLIPPLIEKWEKVMGVKVHEFGVKQMKTRWGTCNIGAQRIWINLELAKKPPQCLEYIVVHEMVHLLERNHNDKFKAYMDQFLPNWESIQARLND